MLTPTPRWSPNANRLSYSAVQLHEDQLKRVESEDKERRASILDGMARLNVSTEAQLSEIAQNVSYQLEARMLACSLLGLMRARQSLPVLFGVAGDLFDSRLKWQAYWSIGMVGSQSATRQLMHLVKREASLPGKSAVIFALGLLADRRCEHLLALRLLDTTEYCEVRSAAAEALGLLQLRRWSKGVLLKALGDEDPHVKSAVLGAIGTARLKEAQFQVRAMMSDLSLVRDGLTIAEIAANILAQLKDS